MGCDIHISLEIMNVDGKWELDTRIANHLIPDERYYAVWGYLFDVRNGDEYDEHPYKGLGWPKDTVTEDNHDWFHSHTVINYDLEAFEKLEWPLDLEDCYFRAFLEQVWGRFKRYTYVSKPVPKHMGFVGDRYWTHPMRMIIAFDN